MAQDIPLVPADTAPYLIAFISLLLEGSEINDLAIKQRVAKNDRIVDRSAQDAIEGRVA